MNRAAFFGEVFFSLPNFDGTITRTVADKVHFLFKEGGSTARYWASGYPINTGAVGGAGAVALDGIAQALNAGDYDFLKQYDGPFLAMVHQVEQQRIIVARDKFGLRSAYYKLSPEGCQVSDDIANLNHENDVRITALSEWLHYGAPLAPLTLFRGINTIPPGAILEISLRDFAVKTINYFTPEDHILPDLYRQNVLLDKRELAEKFNTVFNGAIANAVQGQSKATILLSGGVDSSLLTAFTRNHAEVTAVTVDIYGPGGCSEVVFADAVAKKLGVRLDVVRFGPSEFIGGFCQTIRDLGCPIIIENAVALNHVSRSGNLPRGQLVLDGEGADALMAGSTSLFKYSMMVRHLAHVTPLSAGTIRKLMQLMRRFLNKAGIATKTTLDGVGLDIDLAARRMELQYLESRIRQKFAHLRSQEDIEIASLMLREFYDYLVPLMLRIDKMSAASDTHTLLPFLSAPVFQFLANLDMGHKIGSRGLSLKPTSKLFLKARLEEYLPKDLVYRPKVGFGIPAWNWVSYPECWRKDSWIAEFFQLNPDALNHWINTTVNRDKLFFLSLEVWGRIFGRGIPFEVVEREWLHHNCN